MPERRRVLRRAAWVLAAAVFGVAWTFGLHSAHVHVADWYLPLLCAIGSGLIALRPATRRITVPTRMVHGAPDGSRPEVIALRGLESQVTRAVRDAGSYDARLAPLLRQLAGERARQLGLTDDDLPALLGEDAWRWLTTGTTRRRPPTTAELGRLIGRVENLYPPR